MVYRQPWRAQICTHFVFLCGERHGLSKRRPGGLAITPAVPAGEPRTLRRATWSRVGATCQRSASVPEGPNLFFAIAHRRNAALAHDLTMPPKVGPRTGHTNSSLPAVFQWRIGSRAAARHGGPHGAPLLLLWTRLLGTETPRLSADVVLFRVF